MENLKKEMIASLHTKLTDVVETLDFSHVLKQSIGYTLLNWGKLFRPCLSLMILQDLQGNYKKGLEYAAAIELVHVYGLLHDDLPALDDARYRRKKLVNHLVYGEAQAILAGDALQAEAFNLIAHSQLEAKYVVKLVKLMAKLIGANGYVGGQSLDIISEKEDIQYIDANMIKKVHFGKTGALFEAAVVGASIIGEATPEQKAILKETAEEIGLAFQIRDDIIDITKTESEVGKDTRSDLKNDKMTYPKLHGLKKSEELFNEHLNVALNNLQEMFGYESCTYNFIREFLKL